MAQSAQIAKINPWHQRFADWLIVNGASPGWNAKAAKEFGRTAAWISTVYHSDAFQDYYANLSADYRKELHQTLSEKIAGAAGQAVDLLAARLETEGAVLPYDTLLETVDVLGKRAGLGETRGSQASTTVNVALVSREELELYRARMRKGSGVNEPLALTAVDVPSSDRKELGNV